MKHIIYLFLLIISSNYITYSQDTIKPKTNPVTQKDTSYVQNFILADHNYQYLNKNNPDTLTRRRFLWYPAKSLEDIFNYLPGYYQYTLDVGQFNPISYNQLLYSQTGVFRHGRPINDIIDGSIDLNLLSRNEIEEIEISNGFGNNVYGYSNSVNIIDRELFRFRPYTEISFYQDRYENLYFDGNFHQNFFRKLNFNFGITKHSYDGHYTNSDFDKWLGRFNLNFAPSNKLNFFLNVNYAKIQKGLNEGINPDTVNLGDKDALFNSAKAIVNNPDAYEIKERFDIDLGTVFLAGKNSFTKLQLYVSNSFRKYRDEENRANSNGKYVKNNFHWINYGAKAQEILKFNLMKNIKVVSRSEAEYTYRIIDISTLSSNLLYSNNNIGTVNYLENIDFKYTNFILSGFARGYSADNLKSFYNDYGIKAQYKYSIDSTRYLNLTVQYNSKNKYSSLKAVYSSGENSIGSEFYYFETYNNYIYRGLNNNLKIRFFKIDLEGTYSFNIVPSWDYYNFLTEDRYFPKHYGNLSLCWHDMAFKNKLEYKIGLNSRFWSEYSAKEYSGNLNYLYRPLYLTQTNAALKIPANATLDFYIIGKIGKATFGLTFENILDRIIYNTGVYPFMDRGGFLNTISRFNITWNFFD